MKLLGAALGSEDKVGAFSGGLAAGTTTSRPAKQVGSGSFAQRQQLSFSRVAFGFPSGIIR